MPTSCSARTRELHLSRFTIELDEPELIAVDDLVFEVFGGESEDGGVILEEGEGVGEAEKDEKKCFAHDIIFTCE